MCNFHPSAQPKLRVSEPVSAPSSFFATEDVTAHLSTDPELDSVSVLPLFAPALFSNDIHYESILPCLRAVTLALTSSLGLRALHVLFTGFYWYIGKELTKEAAPMYEIREDPYDVSELTDQQAATIKNKYLDHLADLVRYRSHNDSSGGGYTVHVKQSEGRCNDVLKGNAADIFIPKNMLDKLEENWIAKHDPDSQDSYDPVVERVAQIELTHLIGHELAHAIYYARITDLRIWEPFIGDEMAVEWGFTLEKALFGAIAHRVKCINNPPYVYRDADGVWESEMPGKICLFDWPCNFHMLGYKTVGADMKLRSHVLSREDVIERYSFQRAAKLFTVSFWRDQVPVMGRRAFDIVLPGTKAILVWTEDETEDKYRVRELNAGRQGDSMLADVSTLRCAQPDVVPEPKSSPKLNENGKRSLPADEDDDSHKTKFRA